MRERMLVDEERSEQAFEELSLRIALEAHEDRLKLWEDVERLTRELEQLRRIDRAARLFVNFLDACAPQGGVWTDHVPTDLLDALQPLELALFDGRASENG